MTSKTHFCLIPACDCKCCHLEIPDGFWDCISAFSLFTRIVATKAHSLRHGWSTPLGLQAKTKLPPVPNSWFLHACKRLHSQVDYLFIEISHAPTGSLERHGGMLVLPQQGGGFQADESNTGTTSEPNPGEWAIWLSSTASMDNIEWTQE